MKPIAYRKELYRLWFEFLKLAHTSSDKLVKSSLKKSNSFYKPWGAVSGIKFDLWWKTHSYLFEENEVVRLLDRNEKLSEDASIIYLAVPLRESTTRLTEKVKEIIKKEARVLNSARSKSTTRPSAAFHPTAGAEPKLKALNVSLTIYRDVFQMNTKLKGQALLDAVRTYYQSRKKNRQLPSIVIKHAYADETVPKRNVRRAISRAERIIRNVAKGEFPGKY